MDTDSSTTRDRAGMMLILGVALFLLGLLNGLIVQYLTNPRMALSAHMAGVQNGMVLLLFGLVWSHVWLPDGLDRLGTWLMIGGMYAIWISLLLAAILGTSSMTPIAGQGFTGSAGAEAVVNTILVAGSGAAVAATVLVLWGLIRARVEP